MVPLLPRDASAIRGERRVRIEVSAGHQGGYGLLIGVDHHERVDDVRGLRFGVVLKDGDKEMFLFGMDSELCKTMVLILYEQGQASSLRFAGNGLEESTHQE